jgi:hypothetical protein
MGTLSVVPGCVSQREGKPVLLLLLLLLAVRLQLNRVDRGDTLFKTTDYSQTD